jgi:hypothetical protein
MRIGSCLGALLTGFRAASDVRRTAHAFHAGAFRESLLPINDPRPCAISGSREDNRAQKVITFGSILLRHRPLNVVQEIIYLIDRFPIHSVV